MKYLSLLLFTALCFTACKKEAKERQLTADDLVSTAAYVASPDQATSDYEPFYIHKIPADKDLNSPMTPVGAHGQILQPELNSGHVQALIKGIWTFEFYLDDDASIPQKIAATGQWLQFLPDGTFKGGHWQRQTHGGAWYIDLQDPAAPVITLDSNVDRLDAKWQVQSIDGPMEQMGWVRMPNSGFGLNHRSIPAKLIQLTDLPTRKQFAKQLGGL